MPQPLSPLARTGNATLIGREIAKGAPHVCPCRTIPFPCRPGDRQQSLPRRRRLFIPADGAMAQANAQLVPDHSLRAMHIGKTIVERSLSDQQEIFSYYSPEGRLYLGYGGERVRVMNYDIYGDQLCINPNGQMACYRVYVFDGQPYYVLPSGRAYSSIEYVPRAICGTCKAPGQGLTGGAPSRGGSSGLGAFCATFGCGGGGSSYADDGGGSGSDGSSSSGGLEWEESRTTGFCGKGTDGENIYSPSCNVPKWTHAGAAFGPGSTRYAAGPQGPGLSVTIPRARGQQGQQERSRSDRAPVLPPIRMQAHPDGSIVPGGL